jgi:hypothetical protein
LSLRVYNMLPQVTLPDLLIELDNWTGFLRPFPVSSQLKMLPKEG